MNDLISKQDAIDILPHAQPKRKIGKWITKEEDYTKQTYCSECGKNAPFIFVADDYYGNYARGKTMKTNFCPNCGADMRGDDAE